MTVPATVLSHWLPVPTLRADTDGFPTCEVLSPLTPLKYNPQVSPLHQFFYKSSFKKQELFHRAIASPESSALICLLVQES